MSEGEEVCGWQVLCFLKSPEPKSTCQQRCKISLQENAVQSKRKPLSAVNYLALQPSSVIVWSEHSVGLQSKYFLPWIFTFLKGRMLEWTHSVTEHSTCRLKRGAQVSKKKKKWAQWKECAAFSNTRVHTHLPRLPLEQQIKREITLSPLHRATVANRQLSVATGWPSFYGYGVPSHWTMTAGGGRKKIRRDFSMWASLGLLWAGFITANKRC